MKDEAMHDALAIECADLTALVEAKWPTAPHRSKVDAVTMKLAEEVGELIGAVVKLEQGRTDKDWLDEARQELGDVMIVLAQVSTLLAGEGERTRGPVFGNQFGLVIAMRNRWRSVSRRKGTAEPVEDDGQDTLPDSWMPKARSIDEASPLHRAFAPFMPADIDEPHDFDATGPGHG